MRSDSIASSTPGYCTFTATARPSFVMAPMDLADRRRRERDRIPPVSNRLVGAIAEALPRRCARRQFGSQSREHWLGVARVACAPARAGLGRDSSPSGRSSSVRPSCGRGRRRCRPLCAAPAPGRARPPAAPRRTPCGPPWRRRCANWGAEPGELRTRSAEAAPMPDDAVASRRVRRRRHRGWGGRARRRRRATKPAAPTAPATTLITAITRWRRGSLGARGADVTAISRRRPRGPARRHAWRR